jgi:hypothetical protein
VSTLLKATALTRTTQLVKNVTSWSWSKPASLAARRRPWASSWSGVTGGEAAEMYSCEHGIDFRPAEQKIPSPVGIEIFIVSSYISKNMAVYI